MAGSGPITIDLQFLDTPGVVAAFVLPSADDAALIEVGPASTLDALLAGIARQGIARERIRHLLVTHIHLDHAGAAGRLLSLLPHATLYAHEAGVPHLIDPSRLVASAERIYGGLMGKLWGDIVPAPADRIVALRDGDRLHLAGRALDVLYTPGHASHHVAFHDVGDGSIFAGDVAGVRLQGCTYVRPPTPPPDLDLDLWNASLDRLAALAPAALYLTHFGRFEGSAAHIDELRTRLHGWDDLVLAGMRAGQDRATIADAMRRDGDGALLEVADAETVRRYDLASAYAMNVSGYERSLRKRYPALASPPQERRG